jgi:HEPN domain-containing protein
VVAVTGRSLAESYLRKAAVRAAVLSSYLEAEDYSDAVREAQEVVELALKAALRVIGVDPPKVHDVGALLREYADRFPGIDVTRWAAISRRLRKDRELAFYGDLDFLPTEEYTLQDAEQAVSEAREVASGVRAWVDGLAGGPVVPPLERPASGADD